MSLLESLFNIDEVDGATGILLPTPVARFFSFDFASMTKENNSNSSVLWNFGDPESGDDNEYMSSSLTKAIVKHIYKYSGTYQVHAIANVNGVIFQIDQTVVIAKTTSDIEFLFGDNTFIKFGDMTVPTL
jgi:hypothetical protein